MGFFETLRRSLLVAGLTLAGVGTLQAAVPSPKSHFGFDIGDDYMLANYTQTEAYFRKVAASSDRFRLVELGKSSEGRPQLMLIASSPANLARLEEYRGISERLARARDDAQAARALAEQGKAVVWIDGGLHANETVGPHQLIETVWQLASRDDAETRRILDDTIVLLVHANPDGQELYSDWYMREPVPAKRVLDKPQRLYQKYAGHDNNRDFYMAALQETRNMNLAMYTRWYPQIVYNHHQAAPKGTVIVIPPYRDPYNYNIDPMIPVGLEALGSAMNLRYLQENKPGAVSKGGSVYSTWWNGGLRTMPYFHNMLGVLTEIVGNPTPMQIPYLPERQLPDSNLPAPVTAQTWHFRQSIDYSLTANWALLDYASRHREQLLWNIYWMGRNAIARGSTDTWTASPTRLAEAAAQAKAATTDAPQDGLGPRQVAQWLQRPDQRDARGYIIPADQADLPTAVAFVNALQLAGVEVQRASRAFVVAGKSYPAGSFVVRADQAFRAHVRDMFEPQDHPHDFEYEGGPPIAPYDSAGWTLAFQMGVAFDRVLEAFDGPFAVLPVGQLQAPADVPVPASSRGWLLDARVNNAFIAVNRLLKAGARVSRVPSRDGAFLVAGLEADALAVALRGTGVAAAVAPADVVAEAPLRAPRIALWDRYGGSMVSGWTRLVLENFGFDYEVVYPQQILAGDLRQRFDVLLLPSGALPLPAELAIEGKAGRTPASPDPATIPAEYRSMLGELQGEPAVAALRQFMGQGGHVVATGSSSGLALQLGLPVASHLRKPDAAGQLKPLSQREYYIPGSVLEVAVDKAQPLNWGLPARLDVYFSDGRWDNAPVLDLPAGRADIQPLLRFDGPRPLRSGWAWGQEHLQGGVLAAEAGMGAGRLTFFGTDITFRAQTHASFKLLFNSLLQAGATGTAAHE
ncbi:M14 metallopeptidase family protein [Stenotrophomonas sp. MH1]|uniref:M14 metallopeptidase family protein n=1 Tax=Stenotrophomonas capsici TaxID=3110230 RepID=A0ABU5UZE9_9GAMM|nr:M14 metallopeptidase family protein [Stenotrophomonas sp. MH1]MEA5665978.1 M14 metallopeptidase family protein [Stenotrophomonas sp. MH1]